MKSLTVPLVQSLAGCVRRGLPLLFAAATLLLASNEASARGFVAVRGGGGRGFVAAGGYRGGAVAYGGYHGGGVAYRGYGYGGSVAYRGYGYGGVGYRGGFIRTLPAGYRSVYYRGYNCYYVGGVYYRPQFYQGSTVYVTVN